jgi:phosphatidylinositol dimannoside acyltransferase
VRTRLALLAYSAGWSLVRVLPARVAYALFALVADVAWRRQGKGVRRLEGNLARVVGAEPDGPAVRALSRTAMRSYLRYWCDTFRLPDWDRDRVVGSVRAEHTEVLFDNLAAGRGVVAALPHMGNWDHAGAWASGVGAPVTTVAERLRPEELYERFLAYRESLGMEILPLTGGDRDVFRSLLRRAKEGRLVPLLADRDLTATGTPVEFFGATARMPSGPAALALASGAALVPVTLHTEGRAPRHRLVIRFHDEVLPPDGSNRERIAVMMQRVADVFAKGIAEHPEDWHMLQRVWVDPPA